MSTSGHPSSGRTAWELGAAAVGAVLSTVLYALVSLESVAAVPLRIGGVLTRVLPRGASYYTDETSWWPWPSLEWNATRIPDNEFLRAIGCALVIGPCTRIAYLQLLVPGAMALAAVSVALVRFFVVPKRTLTAADPASSIALRLFLVTALSFPFLKFMHFVWQGMFTQVVFTDADAWRAANPGQVHWSNGYPVAIGTFGISGLFLAPLFLAPLMLVRHADIVRIATIDPTRATRIRRIRRALLAGGILFASWPLVVAWVARVVPLDISVRYIPF